MAADFDMEHLFSHHPPDDDQAARYRRVRNAGRHFADAIVAACPPSADRSDAIRKVREAMMTANASIALNGRLHKPTTPT